VFLLVHLDENLFYFLSLARSRARSARFFDGRLGFPRRERIARNLRERPS
jgi:hypothetical protein